MRWHRRVLSSSVRIWAGFLDELADDPIAMTTLTSSVAVTLPPGVRGYLEAIVEGCAVRGDALVAVILFGSAATGGFSGTASDVDLILVVPDDSSHGDRLSLRGQVAALEALHGFNAGHVIAHGRLEAARWNEGQVRYPDLTSWSPATTVAWPGK